MSPLGLSLGPKQSLSKIKVLNYKFGILQANKISDQLQDRTIEVLSGPFWSMT